MQIVTILIFSCFGCGVFSWVAEMENKNLFQGDIQLDPDERVGSNGYASIIGGRWPNNVVPYDLSKMSTDAHQSILNAIADYQRRTCLKFVKRTNEPTYLSFFVGNGCSSPVGYRQGRINTISLGRGCLGHGTILHEIGHSIGLYHEQSRPDRDNYVTIVWNNIQKEMQFNFNKETNIDSLQTSYDYNSIMHYGATAFGNGKSTIITKDPSKQQVIGNRSGFSTIDVQQINAMYNCKMG
ncbi:blastula protease 10 [Hydra vulgaris]|uniref:blastula protease 10 n=1 Tax=Hydra vulgaris TaxID=6087 RepID=UPI000641129D|nr:blastula protease 10 [Hydra vulgaris]